MEIGYVNKYLFAIATLMLSVDVLAGSVYVSSYGSGSECSKIAPCSSIQAAIELASAGDTVNVGKGIYYENITIARNKTGLTIKGEGDEETSSKQVAPAAQSNKKKNKDGDGFSANRQLCPDGGCIGIIGSDGTCKMCGTVL